MYPSNIVFKNTLIFFSRIVLLLILLILSMSSFDTVGGFSFLWQRVFVEVLNDLGQGLDLTIHCKSDDDDLGVQLIKYPDVLFKFNFRPNAKGTNLFYCTFHWSNEFCCFNIYVFDRDHPQCSNCSWKIRPTGPCKLNYVTSQHDLCFPWNSN